MEKRVLSILLAAVLALSLAVPAFAQEPEEAVTGTPGETEATEPPAETAEPEPSEEPADEPVDEPADEPEDEPAEPTEEPADEPAPVLPAAEPAADVPMPAAEAGDVPYVDANGEGRTCTSAVEVDSGADAWSEGWYVVRGAVTIGRRITVTGNVNLILADGCSLTAKEGITVPYYGSLTIWGQSAGSGKLTAAGADGNAAIGGEGIGGGGNSNVGQITINGGTVEATGGSGAAGIGAGQGGYTGEGSITINGGAVTATGGDGSTGIGVDGVKAYGVGGPVTITGGSVTAKGGRGGGNGIMTGSGRITISGGTVEAAGGDGGGNGIMSENGAITITGDAVTAKGGSGDTGGAGIVTLDENITISGGTVEAVGGDGSTQGGAAIQAGVTVFLRSGTVTAKGGSGGSGGAGIAAMSEDGGACISGGMVTVTGGITGDFYTTDAGQAVIVCDKIEDTGEYEDKEFWSGLICQGGELHVYGSQTLTKAVADRLRPDGLHVEDAGSLTIEEDVELTLTQPSEVADTGSLTNRGVIRNESTLCNHNVLVNDGTIYNDGTLHAHKPVTGSGRIIGDAPLRPHVLRVEDMTFSAEVGYAPAEQAVTVRNAGFSDSYFTDVTVDGEDFELIEGKAPVKVETGEADTTWRIKPRAGLPAGTYTALITVVYTGSDEDQATGRVTFTVRAGAADKDKEKPAGGRQDKAPPTGDGTDLALYAGALLVSAGALAPVLAGRKKRRS